MEKEQSSIQLQAADLSCGLVPQILLGSSYSRICDWGDTSFGTEQGLQMQNVLEWEEI